eukprot:3443254-Alexandrium_andersonii.AAC.1
MQAPRLDSCWPEAVGHPKSTQCPVNLGRLAGDREGRRGNNAGLLRRLWDLGGFTGSPRKLKGPPGELDEEGERL